jgi:hypothetical protein
LNTGSLLCRSLFQEQITKRDDQAATIKWTISILNS